MRRYTFRCPTCDRRIELRTRVAPICCGAAMVRDFRADAVSVAYHPTKGTTGGPPSAR